MTGWTRKVGVGTWLLLALAIDPSAARGQEALLSTGSPGAGGLEAMGYANWLGAEQLGLGARLSWGVADPVTLRGQLAFFDGFKTYAVFAELHLARSGATALSALLGTHRTDYGPGTGFASYDAALVVRGGEGDGRLSPYAALHADFGGEVFDVRDAYSVYYAVVGVDVPLGEEIGLVAEGGLGLSELGASYLSAGLALRFE